MLVENADAANPKAGHLLREPGVTVAKLRMRVRIGGNRKRNPFLYRQFNDPIAWIEFVHRLAPSSGGMFDCEVPGSNKIECFVDNNADFQAGPMTMNLNKIKVSEAIDQPGCRHFANTAKIISVNCIDVMPFELLRAIWHAVEHSIGATKKVHGTENKIEFVPMLLNPFSAGFRVNGIVIELNASADSQMRISLTQTIDFIEVDARVITIMIGKSDVG